MAMAFAVVVHKVTEGGAATSSPWPTGGVFYLTSVFCLACSAAALAARHARGTRALEHGVFGFVCTSRPLLALSQYASES